MQGQLIVLPQDEFDKKFPGFESDIHGLRFEPLKDGGRRYMVDCVAESKVKARR